MKNIKNTIIIAIGVLAFTSCGLFNGGGGGGHCPAYGNATEEIKNETKNTQTFEELRNSSSSRI